jgi:S-formylglutathione hydrolase FrmB
VLAGREHIGIAGISMGGYGAVKTALKHPELVGFAGTMSGALDITRRHPSLKRWEHSGKIWTIFGATENGRKDEDVFDLVERQRDGNRVKWFSSCSEQDSLLAVNRRCIRAARE